MEAAGKGGREVTDELPFLDPEESERRKAEGQRIVTANEREHWKMRIALVIDGLRRRGLPFTGDDVRERAAARGIPEPHHPNAYGAAMTAAARKGRIQKTGRYVKSSIPSRHAAVVAEWVATPTEAS